jgi:hypothetical protein
MNTHILCFCNPTRATVQLLIDVLISMPAVPQACSNSIYSSAFSCTGYLVLHQKVRSSRMTWLLLTGLHCLPPALPSCTDPLVLHHQLLRDCAASHRLPDHHPAACAEKRLPQVLPRRCRAGWPWCVRLYLRVCVCVCVCLCVLVRVQDTLLLLCFLSC